MKVAKATPKDKKPKMVPLKDLKPGSDYIFRFPETTAAEAESGKDDAVFFMVIGTQPAKSGRVTVVSVDGKLVRECDDDRMVIPHRATLQYEDPEMVDAE